MKTRKRFTNWFLYKTCIISIATYWKNRLLNTCDIFSEASRFMDFYETTDKKPSFEKKGFGKALRKSLSSELVRIKEIARTNQNLAIVSLGNLSSLQSRMSDSKFSIVPDEVFQEIESLRRKLCDDVLESCKDTGNPTNTGIFFVIHYGGKASCDDLIALLATRNDWDPIAVYRESLFQITQGNHVSSEKMVKIFLTNSSFARENNLHERLSAITEECLAAHYPYNEIINLYGSIRRALP